MKIIKLKDNNYPKRLREIDNPPKEIYVLGDDSLLNKISIAIVGSRKCSKYGEEQAKRFSSFLSQKGICIVSGLARGIDTIAHMYSKDKTGKTIAVVASGFKHIYPSENKILVEQIINEGGAIVSEWTPETEVDLHRFPARNRIISGLSVGTLVVESSYRSGSNITAHNAMKQKRAVFAIPGNINSAGSIGTNRLIEQGACLVTSPNDIIETLEFEGYKLDEKKVKPEYEEILSLIGTMPISASEISRNINKNISEINQKLLMLELDGFVEQTSIGKYKVKSEE